MNNTKKVHVLNDFKPYLPILQAYNRDQFRQHDLRSIFRSVFHALCASIIILCIPIIAVLYAWYEIENGFELKHVAAAVPMVLSVVHMQVTFISLVWENRQISETIQQLQTMVNGRIRKKKSISESCTKFSLLC